MYSLGFRNTDHLIHKANWDIQLTKTGFTNEAGHCLVLVTKMGNRPMALVILDAFGKFTHFADASRIRSWVETGKKAPTCRQWPCNTRLPRISRAARVVWWKPPNNPRHTEKPRLVVMLFT
nr:hypothetical protein GCM10020185_04240 [Pseudomonas brassicacearum subsp. brassicacearum]